MIIEEAKIEEKARASTETVYNQVDNILKESQTNKIKALVEEYFCMISSF